VFDVSVADAIEESAETPYSAGQPKAASKSQLDVNQPTPPRDPLGEIDPQRSRDYTFAGAVNGVWKTFLQGEKLHKAVEGWKAAGDTLYPPVSQIIGWLRQFLSSGDGMPPMPPSIGI
jgi:hypothetical protein